MAGDNGRVVSWARQVGITIAGLGVALAACSSEPTSHESVGSSSQALTSAQQRILGFESVGSGSTGWTTNAGTLSQSTRHVEGAKSLAIANGGNAENQERCFVLTGTDCRQDHAGPASARSSAESLLDGDSESRYRVPFTTAFVRGARGVPAARQADRAVSPVRLSPVCIDAAKAQHRHVLRPSFQDLAQRGIGRRTLAA